MRSAVLSIAALAPALAFSGGAHSGHVSGLHGVVMEGPTKPVCKVGEPCERPASGVVLQFKDGGHIAARVRTTRKGTYSVRLAAGTYAVTTVPVRKIGTGLTPRTVRVPKGRMARRDFHLDTGLQ